MDKNEVYKGIAKCSGHKDRELRKLMLVALDNINTTHQIKRPPNSERERTASLMALTWEAGRQYNSTHEPFID